MKKRRYLVAVFFATILCLTVYLRLLKKLKTNRNYKRFNVEIKNVFSKLIVCKENITQSRCAVSTPINPRNSSSYKFINHWWQFNGLDGVEIHSDILCPPIPFDLGPVADDEWIMTLNGLSDMYHLVIPGGIYVPTECTALQSVAVIVPIFGKSRLMTKAIGNFLFYIHPFLIRQQTAYQIFMISKKPSLPYKRGELYNVGFKEAQAYLPNGWDCIIFHEIHLMPSDTRNLYRCSGHPRKLIADFQKPHRFGGAVAMRPSHYLKVNGFSNNEWPNDGDYIDMYKRILAANLSVETNVVPIGNYTMFDALKLDENGSKYIPRNLSDAKDGLSNISYSINRLELRHFYTLIEITD